MGQRVAERVLSLRSQYPRWGKDIAGGAAAREKCRSPTSMVGRHPGYWKRRTGVLACCAQAGPGCAQARRKLRNAMAIRKPKILAMPDERDLVEIDTNEIVWRGSVPPENSPRLLQNPAEQKIAWENFGTLSIMSGSSSGGACEKNQNVDDHPKRGARS